MTDPSVDRLRARIVELERRIEALEHENLEFEREVARRGVKLSCANIALSRAKIAFDEQSRQLLPKNRPSPRGKSIAYARRSRQ